MVEKKSGRKYIKMRLLFLSVCETNNQLNIKVSFCYAPTIVMNLNIIRIFHMVEHHDMPKWIDEHPENLKEPKYFPAKHFRFSILSHSLFFALF